MGDIPAGFCECGCGGRTTLRTKTDRAKGMVKGEYARFIKGHTWRGRNLAGSANPQWRGGVSADEAGYRLIYKGKRPRGGRTDYAREHVMLAERALGKPLPAKADVHHVNGDKSDNRPQNLVICEDRAYHMLLHRRTRALQECGNANWLKCCICKEYSPPEETHLHETRKAGFYHLKCKVDRNRELRANRRGGPPTRTKGTQIHTSKLTPEIVRAMRSEAESGASASAIARKYGVANSTAWKAINRVFWKHVE